MDDTRKPIPRPIARPGELAAHCGRVGRVLAVEGPTARMSWPDGSTGYVRTEALAPAAPEPPCSPEQALDFVARMEAKCRVEGGQTVATPLRVLRALASLAQGGRDARRAG